MLVGGIRSVYKLKFMCDGEMKYFIARRKASVSPIILPQYTEVLFGKSLCIKIFDVTITISYDVVYYTCGIVGVITSDTLKELTNMGFKEVDENGFKQ